jgi:signal transduction histidine kinase
MERTSGPNGDSAEPTNAFDDFLRDAVHDLRTPLASIAAGVEALQAGAKDDPERRELFLGHVEHSAQHAAQLLDALVILARARSGDALPNHAPVALRPLLDRIAEVMEAETSIQVVVTCPPSLGVVANQPLIEQLLANLLLNAARHSSANGVTIAAGPDGSDDVRIDVVDDGTGFAETSARELDALHAARSPGTDAEALGIGLTIVREAVTALGGSVEIESRNGAGTTARVTLPRAPDRAP